MPQVSVNCIWIANNINNTGFFSDDIFTIDELAVYEGKHNDQTYAVAGDILDGVYFKVNNILTKLNWYFTFSL